MSKVKEWGNSPVELMRAISSNFDDNVMVTTNEDVVFVSDGISMTLLGQKARLLNGIQDTFASGITLSSDLLEQENMHLRHENLMLKNMINKIEERLAALEASLPKQRVVVLREISKEDAKKEVRRLFSTGKTLYYSDIARELELDLELVVEICNELQAEGEIAIDARVP